MRFRRIVVAGLGLAVAVGASIAAVLMVGGDRQPSRTGPGTSAVTGFLVVDQRLDEAFFFSEGAFPLVELESADGTIVVETLIRDTRGVQPLLRRSLAPGKYRLTIRQRPCAGGGCPARGVRGLDPPTAGCRRTVEIEAGATLSVAVRATRPAPTCDLVLGERIDAALAYDSAFDVCRGAAANRHHTLRHLAKNWAAKSTRAEDLGAAYAATYFRGFEPSISEAAGEGCVAGIDTITEPIRFRLAKTYTSGERITVSIENVGTRAYLFQFPYQACFLSYFDSSGRRFIIPPGTHCDVLSEETIRPGERKRLFRWSLDECVKDQWGCVESRPLPPGTYTIKGRFEPKAAGTPARVETTFRIVAT